jgi:hypothetical protein
MRFFHGVSDALKLRFVHIKFVAIVAGAILLQSCATQTTRPPSSANSCTFAFHSNTPSQICGWYWDNNFPQCDSVMSAELNRRNLTTSPRQLCGTSKSSTPAQVSSAPSCSYSFTTDPTERICNWYWGNTFRQCDSVMAAELNRRNLNISPQSACGTPRAGASAQSPAGSGCTQSYRSASSSDICRAYWGNLNLPCDGAMRAEMSARNLAITPSSECGKPLGTTSSATRPAQTVSSCSVSDLSSFSSQPIQQLCSIASGAGPCRGAARIAIQGRGLSPGGNSGSCGQPDSGRCGQLLSRFNSAPNPVQAACSVRSSRTSEEGLMCRSSINGFLLARGVSSGLVSGSICGQLITERELQQINR